MATSRGGRALNELLALTGRPSQLSQRVISYASAEPGPCRAAAEQAAGVTTTAGGSTASRPTALAEAGGRRGVAIATSSVSRSAQAARGQPADSSSSSSSQNAMGTTTGESTRPPLSRVPAVLQVLAKQA